MIYLEMQLFGKKLGILVMLVRPFHSVMLSDEMMTMTESVIMSITVQVSQILIKKTKIDT